MNELKQLESEIIEACIDGDRAAQNQLYQKYKASMFGICLRYAKSQTEAEDMLLEGFYKVFRDLGQLHQRNALAGWMRKVMVNNAIAYIRKHRKKELLNTDLEKARGQHLIKPQVWHKDDAESIIRFIRTLPVGYQTIFNLYAVEGYSHKEIAQMLQIAESTSRSQYTRARKLLQKMLSESEKE